MRSPAGRLVLTCSLTRAAEDDVVAIYEAGARIFGPAQADRYHASLKAAFELLAQFPRSARERVELSPAVHATRISRT